MFPKESKHILLNALMQTKTGEHFYMFDPCTCLIIVMEEAQEEQIHGTNCILAHGRFKCFCFEEKTDKLVLALNGTRLVMLPVPW